MGQLIAYTHLNFFFLGEQELQMVLSNIFTIEEDDNTAPVINLADVTINESDVEFDDGNVRDFDDLNDYMDQGNNTVITIVLNFRFCCY